MANLLTWIGDANIARAEQRYELAYALYLRAVQRAITDRCPPMMEVLLDDAALMVAMMAREARLRQ